MRCDHLVRAKPSFYVLSKGKSILTSTLDVYSKMSPMILMEGAGG